MQLVISLGMVAFSTDLIYPLRASLTSSRKRKPRVKKACPDCVILRITESGFLEAIAGRHYHVLLGRKRKVRLFRRPVFGVEGQVLKLCAEYYCRVNLVSIWKCKWI